jgi:hypothetical protein
VGQGQSRQALSLSQQDPVHEQVPAGAVSLLGDGEELLHEDTGDLRPHAVRLSPKEQIGHESVRRRPRTP